MTSTTERQAAAASADERIAWLPIAEDSVQEDEEIQRLF